MANSDRFSLIVNSNQVDAHKIIVGVDYGTTYTGVSWVPTTAERTAKSVNIIQTWPGPSKDADITCKTPSRIAFRDENDWLNDNQWGYCVTPKMKSYSWTKLLIYRGPSSKSVDDPTLSSTSGASEAGMLKLPTGMTATEVCQSYLEEVYKFTMSVLEQRIGKEMLEQTALEFWFTVPAIWLDKSKAETKRIALAAGFGKRGDDSIYLIAEPEAAAVSTLADTSQSGLDGFLEPGDSIMICDCGGGTVDLTTYSIVSVAPHMRFKELLVGSGGRCGSTYVDRQFISWMKSKFNSHFTSLPPEKIGPGSRFMKEFESHKKDFGASDTPEYEVTLNMPHVRDSDIYDTSERQVRFYKSDMVDFFRPAVLAIKSLIQQQLDMVKGLSTNPIKKILLVGGFGDSRYLGRELDYWCKAHYPDVEIITPKDPQAAVVKGAALRGLMGMKPDERMCRRHYGYSAGKYFREGIDDESHAYWTEWDQRKCCSSRMYWGAKKGQELADDSSVSFGMMTTVGSSGQLSGSLNLYSCEADEAPEYSFAPEVDRVGSIYYTANLDTDILPSKVVDGIQIWKVEYDIEVVLSAQEGYLKFRMLYAGKEYGAANIKYS